MCDNGCNYVPKLGYTGWHSMADRMADEGKEQTQCETCERWRFDHESAACPDFKPMPFTLESTTRDTER